MVNRINGEGPKKPPATTEGASAPENGKPGEATFPERLPLEVVFKDALRRHPGMSPAKLADEGKRLSRLLKGLFPKELPSVRMDGIDTIEWDTPMQPREIPLREGDTVESDGFLNPPPRFGVKFRGFDTPESSRRDAGAIHEALGDQLGILGRPELELNAWFNSSGIPEISVPPFMPQLPGIRWVDPAKEGRFAMTTEQMEASLLLQTNFEAFWKRYGDGETPANDVSPLTELGLGLDILHRPENVLGETSFNPRLRALDEIVLWRIKADEKIVIYTESVAEANALAERYRSHGAIAYTGKTKVDKKPAILKKFMDDDARILVGADALLNLGSGVDVPPADAYIFATVPSSPEPFHRISTSTGVFRMPILGAGVVDSIVAQDATIYGAGNEADGATDGSASATGSQPVSDKEIVRLLKRRLLGITEKPVDVIQMIGIYPGTHGDPALVRDLTISERSLVSFGTPDEKRARANRQRMWAKVAYNSHVPSYLTRGGPVGGSGSGTPPGGSTPVGGGGSGTPPGGPVERFQSNFMRSPFMAPSISTTASMRMGGMMMFPQVSPVI